MTFPSESFCFLLIHTRIIYLHAYYYLFLRINTNTNVKNLTNDGIRTSEVDFSSDLFLTRENLACNIQYLKIVLFQDHHRSNPEFMMNECTLNMAPYSERLFGFKFTPDPQYIYIYCPLLKELEKWSAHSTTPKCIKLLLLFQESDLTRN